MITRLICWVRGRHNYGKWRRGPDKYSEWCMCLTCCQVRWKHHTLDGYKLAPYPNMTDEDLRDYENAFDVPQKLKGKIQ